MCRMRFCKSDWKIPSPVNGGVCWELLKCWVVGHLPSNCNCMDDVEYLMLPFEVIDRFWLVVVGN